MFSSCFYKIIAANELIKLSSLHSNDFEVLRA